MGSPGDGTVEEPVNREPPAEELVQSSLTASKRPGTPDPEAYDRNHGPIQYINASTHKLAIRSEPALGSSDVLPTPIDVTLSMDDLGHKFRQHTVICALQCAGNRRNELRSRVKEVTGVDWGDGAVMNAAWTGPLLRDVLVDCGLSAKRYLKEYDGLHVQLECNATKVQEDEWYGSSVPLEVVVDPEREALLALHMNGTPLPARHGGPVRAIIPGIIGARSVKWLDTIIVSSRESQNHYQQHDYKILPAEATSPEKAEELGVWDSTPAMQDNPVNSVVTVPAHDGDEVKRDRHGRVRIAGYAIPHGKGGPVERVQVSIDKGNTWMDARILDDGDEKTTHPANKGKGDSRGKFSWVLWEVEDVEVQPAENVSIWSKATDRAGNTMDEKVPEGNWNLRGVGYNAVQGRTGVRIV
ncbi:hypothetical protein PV08_03276 [Exophiala spinifera]|uniref:Sulfite oxidase n=1 Tax=Exophiala spinifera TaxID=91928 RepID=A0A0D2A231_9EURO|nr:uncharacterized protein PV08_03276 [Exophiala spinifera]KIW18987.1 hypothetical protein PV08_03276 [Exophiala spinifera]